MCPTLQMEKTASKNKARRDNISLCLRCSRKGSIAPWKTYWTNNLSSKHFEIRWEPCRMTMISTSANEKQCFRQDINSASGLVPHNLLSTRKNVFQISSLSLFLILLLQDYWSPANRLLHWKSTIMRLFKGEKLVYFNIPIYNLHWLLVSFWMQFKGVMWLTIWGSLWTQTLHFAPFFRVCCFRFPPCTLNQKGSRRQLFSFVDPQLGNSSLSRSGGQLAFRNMVNYLSYIVSLEI